MRPPFPELSLLTGLLLLAAPARAGERFELQRRPLLIPERGTVTSDVIVTDGYEFAFVPPEGWRTEFDAKRKRVTFSCYESNATMGLRVILKSDADSYAVDREALRQQVLRQHPGARVLQELSCYTGDGSGPAFDLEEASPNGPKRVWRLAFVSFSGGVFEFNLFANPKTFDDYLVNFGTLLTSFHVQATAVTKK